MTSYPKENGRPKDFYVSILDKKKDGQSLKSQENNAGSVKK
jgi:hypothetical protein